MNRLAPPLDSGKIHTLVDLFDARVAASPGQPAYRQYLPGVERWHGYTWNDLASRVQWWKAALHAEGLSRGDRIAIMSSNRPEWVAADCAALALGLVVVALFSEDTAGNAAATLAHAGARLLVLEEPQWWEDIQQADPLPELQRVIAIKGGISRQDPRARDLANWLPAPDAPRPHFDEHRPAPDDLAVICYTSGTSGRPKGVMLTHANILSNVIACHAVIPMQPGDVALSFLPLAHMFERTAGFYHAMLAGCELVFTRGIAHLSDDFREVQPTVIISVPRVFERFYALIQQRLAQRPLLFRAIFKLATSAGWRRFEFEQGRAPSPFLGQLAKRLDQWLGRKVLAALGGRIRLAVSGGAPLSPQIARLFISLGLPLVQGYGLTEAGPVVSTNRAGDNDPESVGLPLPGVETRRAANGELQVRGPSVMQGYWKDPESTAAALSDDGWLSTGDKVSRLQSDRVYLVGRLKELIVMSNGEKAAPGLLEQTLLMDPIVEQVIVIGEARPFLAALVVPQQAALDAFCAAEDVSADTPALEAALLRRFHASLKDQPKFAQIRRLALLPQAWTPQNEMLTPTYKPRRRRIAHVYAADIDALYAGHFQPGDVELNYHVDLG